MLSNSDRLFVSKALEENLRLDGRGMQAYRPISVRFYESFGKVEAKIGNTSVFCNVSGELVEPREGRPNEGMFSFHVDCSLLTPVSKEHSLTTQATELSHLIERILRGSRVVNNESLCVVSGSKVWSVRVDARCLNDDGNLLDCCYLAVVCGLMHYRREATQEVDGQLRVYSFDEADPIALSIHHFPVLLTFGLYQLDTAKSSKIKLVLDCSRDEEELSSGSLSVAVNQFGELCGLHKPGGIGISHTSVADAVNMASTIAQDVYKLVFEKQQEDQLMRKMKLRNIHKIYTAEAVRVE